MLPSQDKPYLVKKIIVFDRKVKICYSYVLLFIIVECFVAITP